MSFQIKASDGLVYNLDSTPEERLDLLQRAAGAHASRNPGWHSFDYYAPTAGNTRFHSSAQDAPIYIVGQSG